MTSCGMCTHPLRHKPPYPRCGQAEDRWLCKQYNALMFTCVGMTQPALPNLPLWDWVHVDVTWAHADRATGWQCGMGSAQRPGRAGGVL
ncbi:hypothetical protein BaRGS_00004542 [Batillaria attramentaria]|uniref:Uncharacterized protein n=1 Tax=Batillaria attramentaria TaxID=370345 RepID=A0ABD0LYP4_9CAEN